MLSTFIGLIVRTLLKAHASIKAYKEKLNGAFDQLTYVYKEIKPNSGSSLYDKITQISNELKQARSDIHLQSHITRQIRNDMPNLLYCEFDKSGRMVFANRNLQTLVGMDEDEILNMGWISFFDEKERDIVYNRWIESVKNKIPFQATFSLKKQGAIEEYLMKIEPLSGLKDEDILYYTGKITKK